MAAALDAVCWLAQIPPALQPFPVIFPHYSPLQTHYYITLMMESPSLLWQLPESPHLHLSYSCSYTWLVYIYINWQCRLAEADLQSLIVHAEDAIISTITFQSVLLCSRSSLVQRTANGWSMLGVLWYCIFLLSSRQKKFPFGCSCIPLDCRVTKMLG